MDGKERALAHLRFQGDHGLVALKNIRIRTLEDRRIAKPNEWVDLFENTKGGRNYDFVVNGDGATEEQADAIKWT